MVGRDATPNDVGRNPALIRAAQNEYAKMDVLVCGNCWTVCHFIEEFKQHKEKPCKRDPANTERDSDTRPNIWAFLLWKAKKLNNAKVASLSAPASWALYQSWVKLEPNIRETWIVAGKTILNFTLGSKGDLMEMPVKITKTVVNREIAAKNKLPLKPPGTTNAKSEAESSLLKAATTGRRPPVATVVGKQIPPGAQNKQITRLAKRTPTASEDNTEIVEENVEKIVAKRFNPRRSMHEYLVKWENRTHEQNTWEPLVHLENVPHLLENFERQLAIQKESRARQINNANAKANTPRKPDEPLKSPKNATEANKANEVKTPTNERPQRTSKTRAMDQVKQWMSGGSPTRSTTPPAAEANFNSDFGGTKRKLSENDIPTLTNTMEDLEDDLIPKHTVKRLRNGDALAVEVKTLTRAPKPKVLKVNGNTSLVSGESVVTGPNTSDIIRTNNKENTGIVNKPGVKPEVASLAKKSEEVVRVLNDIDLGAAKTGVVRLSGGAEIRQGAISPLHSVMGCVTLDPRTGTTMIRTSAGGSTISRNQPLTKELAQQHTELVRKKVEALRASGRAYAARFNPQPSSSSTSSGKTPVTPEQKILQLSKSGDLKVTKKLMTQEDVQQRQQQMRQQPTSSQVQIQKVQQLATATNTNTNATMSIGSGVTAVLKERYSPSPDESILCPVTGKLLGPAGEAQQQQEQLQKEQAAAEVLQAAQMMEELQQQQQQQQQQLQQQQQQQQLPQQHLNVLLQQDAEQQQLQQQQQQLQELGQAMLLTTGEHQMITNEDGTPLLVTGEDGTIYQVAGKNAEGQTILVTQGPDGEQHFAYVATVDNDENQVMTLHNAMAEGVAQMPNDQQTVNALAMTPGGQYLVKTVQEDGSAQVIAMTEAEFNQHQALMQQQQEQAQIQQLALTGPTATVTVTTNGGQLCIQTIDADGTESSIPAEVVQADLPSQDGTRRVVLLLQDGTFMMTEIHENEFKTLNVAA